MKFAVFLLLCLFVGALAKPHYGSYEDGGEEYEDGHGGSYEYGEGCDEDEGDNDWDEGDDDEEEGDDEGCSDEEDESSSSESDSSSSESDSSSSEESNRISKRSTRDRSNTNLEGVLSGLSAGDLLNNVVQVPAQLLGLKGVKDLPDLISKLLSSILGVPLQTILGSLSSINLQNLLQNNSPLRLLLQQLPLVGALTDLIAAVLSLVSDVIKVVVLLLNLVLNLVLVLLGTRNVTIKI